MAKARPSIYEYSNFREFLRASCDHLKDSVPCFSYRYFAKKAGFSSASYLSLVMDGKRSLTKDYVPGFARAVGLNRREQQYFDSMVSFTQAETPEAKRYYLELMYNLRSKRAGNALGDNQYEYLSCWYCPVIREMVSLPDFSDDPYWIRKRLGNAVTAKQVRDAIALMLRLRLIERDSSGRLIQVDGDITTDDEVTHASGYAFHQQMLSLAKNVMAVTGREERDMSAITMAVSRRQFDEIKSMLRDFRESVANYLMNNPDVPADVFQLNLQLFPVSGLCKEGK
jgi:uncharacterized protein (TIGR02147 family)